MDGSRPDMGTPVKKRSASTPSISSPNPISGVEDSPVFNYINDLSPIKSTKTAQSVSLLSFGSPKTPISSLASNAPQKSNVASTGNLSYPLNHEPSSAEKEGHTGQAAPNGIQPVESHDGKGDRIGPCAGATTDALNELPELSFDGFQSTNDECSNSLMETYREQDHSDVMIKVASQPDEISDEPAEFSNELRQCFSNDHDGCDLKSDAFRCKSMSHTEDPKASPSLFIQEDYVDSCSLSFMENILQFSEESTDDIQDIGSIPSTSYDEHDVKVPLAHPNIDNISEAGKASTSVHVADRAAPSSSDEVNIKAGPQQKQMLPRRSLIFEMSGNHYRNLISDTGGTSTVSKQSDLTAVTREKQLVSNKCADRNFSSIRPGIGLHLNTLATTSGNKIVVKQEVSTYKRKLISVPCTTSSFHSTSSDPKPIHSALELNPMGKGLEPETEKENVSQSPAFTGNEESKQINTKKKRCKSENVVEGDSCKRCNCKRSKCLKLYCECFAAGLYCVDPCSCQGCLNKPAFEETVLETRRIIEARNPLAFAPKVIRIPDASEYGDELNTTPASARHKRGCNCKKSGCLKKYCECFQGGVGCSVGCRCEGCRNSFGRKDGVDDILLEEAEDNTIDASFPDQDPLVTPCSEIGRNTCVPLTLVSQFPPISTSFLQPCTNQRLLKTTASFPSRDSSVPTTPHEVTMKDRTSNGGPKDDNDTQTPTSVKSVSPKSKRVMPNHEARHSPPRKFCRKLILRSIPSLPQDRENGMSGE